MSWWTRSGPVLSIWLLELELVPQKPAEASLKVTYIPNRASQPFKERCCSRLRSSSFSSLRSPLGLGCLAPVATSTVGGLPPDFSPAVEAGRSYSIACRPLVCGSPFTFPPHLHKKPHCLL